MHEKQYVIDALTLKDSWRIFHIMAEFVEGFETLPEVYPAVTIFGSARAEPGGAQGGDAAARVPGARRHVVSRLAALGLPLPKAPLVALAPGAA